MTPAVLQAKIDLMGDEDYLKMLAHYERDSQTLLKQLAKKDKMRSAIHTLKSSSYAVGFEDLGSKLVYMEGLIVNGAMSTFDTHVARLSESIEQELIATRQMLLKIGQ
jgi:HPt (histidine-containing phosphotransfer) domain-containing protein